MAEYPQTGSTLTGAISTGLSTQIIVKVNNIAVGAIQSIEAPQTRPLERVVELGMDGVLEIVPKSATQYTIRVTRIVFDKKRLPEAFGRGFINIKSQLVPFDIDIIDRSGGGDGVVNTLKRCWFTEFTPKWEANNFIVSEQASLWCEDVGTVFGGSEKFAAQGGIKPSEYSTGGSAREQEADTGKRRGSMDELGIFSITKAAFE